MINIEVAKLYDNFTRVEDIQRSQTDQPFSTLPLLGRWTVKVGASFVRRKAAFAFIVRNEKGRLVFLASKLGISGSVIAAELQALAWAMEVAEARGWSNLQGYSDSFYATKEVNSNSDPCGWDIRYAVLFCREKPAKHNWSLSWISRVHNRGPDKVAKYTLMSGVPLVLFWRL